MRSPLSPSGDERTGRRRRAARRGRAASVLRSEPVDRREPRGPVGLVGGAHARETRDPHGAHPDERQGALAELRRFVESQREAVAAAEDAGEALVALGVAYVEWAVGHPGAFEVVFDPTVCPPGNPSETMGPLIAENEELLCVTAARVWPDLEPPAAAALEAALWGTVHGLATLVVAGHVPADAVRPALAAVVRR